MKRTANIATMPGREKHLERTIDSIYHQFDRIRVVCNNMTEVPDCLKKARIEPIMIDEDLTDNGKFYALDHITADEYYFTLDDDIIYPANYADTMQNAIRKYHSIISLHGRVLLGVDRKYYSGHQFHHCARETSQARFLDVCGTGVTAFDTRYFKPENLAFDKNKKMSDVIFSHRAAKNERKIVLLPKQKDWIKPQHVTSSIWHSAHKTNQEQQIKLSNEIWQLNRK